MYRENCLLVSRQSSQIILRRYHCLLLRSLKVPYHKTEYQVFLAAFDTIKSIAEKDGTCVFVGRCADYALRDYSNVVNAFIYADIDDRIKRIAKKYELTDAKAKDLIRKEDKSRASYYNYYTSKRWGEMKG